MKRAVAFVLPFALAACGGGPPETPDDQATEVPETVVAQKAPTPAVESEYGTPVEERVATLGLLNKRNNLTQDIEIKVGETRRLGNVVVKLANCERTLPWERPEEEGAFVQVFVQELTGNGREQAWRKVFSGWLFKNSPSLNVVEHPIYDVWVKNCAMNFPGEEDGSASAPSTSEANPTGSDEG
ncbi:hypothetical protein GCM10011371_22310 [Novosphingobium marinum]|uniref:DUF2155 domain-containing protein n=1 Tax=Novosphingobium marinum TaxID=1514948 RepID=A0A7Y9XZT2_9SPHN|nr:DUF2155 domain-containing protein [Novosphingobium marinum]NYH96345.1 hypothetical protein [Novosphingobium marinum]GGC34511.1 hypothetical protein GCM10011371_22310 [Novosphingobium marinum]